uniref:Uncharacterized protein n=1 Tax=Branchiostoma floridae TaxID=7739 RepID=C3YQM8_BRAFL|eukprot:XP_002601372.1 hypothetical protein BRAFLDRAFT_82696 [Branchiostoma floridae]
MGVVSKSSTLLLVFLGLLITQRISAENVLLVPTPCTESLWFTLSNIGQALVGRGHVVTVVVPEDIAEKRRAERPDFKFETFRDQGTHALLKEIDAQDLSNIESETSVYQYARDVTSTTDVITKHCDLLLGDIDLMSRLKAANFSLVVYDCCYPIGAMLAPRMDSRVPYIATLRTELYFLRATGVPLPLAYVPFWGFDFTDNMNFVQRVQNVFTYSLLSILGPWLATDTYDGLVRKYISEKETIKSVVYNTDLWLYQTDHVLDFPAPFMPNMVQIGGLHIGAVSPLPKELETFVQSAGNDGVIVVSFGSIVKTMSSKKTRIFAAAFARLRQKVVWRYTGEKPAGLGNNTKLMSWIPQNDLLARVVARGLGVKLEFSTVTTDQLYQAITHVLTNNSYRETAARLSRLHRDQPQSPMERAVWWIEHVIKHGRLPHLRARAVGLPWYQYHLLDVTVFLFAVCTAVLGTVWYSCSFVCKKTPCKIGVKVKSQ